MRIGINGYYLTTPFSGIGQYTLNILHYLSKIDKKNTYYVFTPYDLEWNYPQNFKKVVIRPLPFFQNTFLNRFLWEEYQLGSAIKQYSLDLYHGLYQSLPKESEKLPSIVTIHDATPWRFPFERKKITYRWYSDIRRKLVTKRARKIIAISEASKLDFASIYGIKPETIEIIYESVNPLFLQTPSEKEIEEFTSKYDIRNDYILYTGGLKRHKNLRMLIKSFAILKEKYKYSGDLYIIGAIRSTMAISSAIYINADILQKYAKAKKIDENVKFVGVVNEKDLVLFYHGANCFISLSLHEGFGLPALEAMTTGTPCVLSNIPAFEEITHNSAVLVYPYGPTRIARALRKVLTDEKLRKKLILRGKKRALFFDGREIARNLLRIYKKTYQDFKE